MRKDPPSYTPRGIAQRMNRAYFWERAARGFQLRLNVAPVFDVQTARVLRHAEDCARHRGNFLAWLYVCVVERKAGRMVLT